MTIDNFIYNQQFNSVKKLALYYGGPEKGNFPLLYVVKMSLRRWVGGSKKASKHPYVIRKDGP